MEWNLKDRQIKKDVFETLRWIKSTQKIWREQERMAEKNNRAMKFLDAPASIDFKLSQMSVSD